MVVGTCWIAVAIISSVIFWVGGVNIWNNISVGLLVFTAFIVTIVIGTGHGVVLETKPEHVLSSELQDIRTKLDTLLKEVEAIKKTIEE